jgi:ligand-binding sensor domain-containing protein
MSDKPLAKQPTRIVPRDELRALLNEFLSEGEDRPLTWEPVTTRDGLPSNWIYDLFQDSAGRIWVGTWGGGAAFRDGGRWQVLTTAQGLESNAVTSFAEGRDGRVWIATDRGLNFYDEGAVHSGGLLGKSLLDIVFDRRGNLWAACWRMGSSGGGLHRFDGTRWDAFGRESGLPGLEILKVFEDSRGNIWVGTYESGRGAGVGRFDGRGWTCFTRSDGLLDDCVYSMFEDPNGHMWFGTVSGISVLDQDRNEWLPLTTLDGLINNQVYCLLIDSKKKMWFGTEGGVSRYDGRTWRSFTKKDGLVEDLVRTILEDRDGRVWLGTYPYEPGKGGISIASYADREEALREKLEKYLPPSLEPKKLPGRGGR